MYAVIKTGGKQHKVTEGELLKVESLPAEEGKEVVFDQVLMVADGDKFQLGKPYLDKATVTATVVKHGRGKKINIIKFRRRKHSCRRKGHRQNFTEVQISKINA